MLEEMISYTEWADEKNLSAFALLKNDAPEAERLFSHILNAQHVWVQRILRKDPLYGIWQVHPKKRFQSISAANFNAIRAVLVAHKLNEQIKYHNSKGESFENTIAEILFQLLNHSTYHRAQLATLFKQEGIVPPITDYIIFKRNQLL